MAIRRTEEELYTNEQLQSLSQIRQALLNHAERFESIKNWSRRRGFSPESAGKAVIQHCILKKPVPLPSPSYIKRNHKTGTPYLFVLQQLAVDTGIRDLFTMRSSKWKWKGDFAEQDNIDRKHDIAEHLGFSPMECNIE